MVARMVFLLWEVGARSIQVEVWEPGGTSIGHIQVSKPLYSLAPLLISVHDPYLNSPQAGSELFLQLLPQDPKKSHRVPWVLFQ